MGEALLVIDTATDRTVVAVRAHPGAALREAAAEGPERGAAGLGRRLAALLEAAGLRPSDLAGIGVGTGPGSFTGLRVGLATAKTLAWSLDVPLVAIPTVDALRAAASTFTATAARLVVVQAAGARDHYLALPGEEPCLVPPGADLAAAVGTAPVLALGADPARIAGVAGPDGMDPIDAGLRAQRALAPALLACLEARLRDGRTDDARTLVPAYVALPRGIAADAGAGWSPDIR